MVANGISIAKVSIDDCISIASKLPEEGACHFNCNLEFVEGSYYRELLRNAIAVARFLTVGCVSGVTFVRGLVREGLNH